MIWKKLLLKELDSILFVTLMPVFFMMNGGDIYDLKMLLNHSSVSVTEKYAKLSPNISPR